MHIFDKNGEHQIDFSLDAETIRLLRINWIRFVDNLEPYAYKYAGKGIVICGGGVKYFTCAWVLIKQLREVGCLLPIELWISKNESIPECSSFLSLNNVTLVKSIDFVGGENVEGWSLKPFAILNCLFKEVLCIDADNICLKNPEFLFDLSEYKATGAIFWKDYWHTARDNPIWEIMNLPYDLDNEFESGQLLLDKEKTWSALNLCFYINMYRDIYYKLLFGDKDTFRFSWLALGYQFHLVNEEPASLGFYENVADNNKFKGITMIQYDPFGKPLFLHRNLIKWDKADTASCIWKYFKKFNELSTKKEYLNLYCATNQHYFMDLGGEYELFDFISIFGDIESRCYMFLDELRAEPFYREFILYEYLAGKIK